MKKNPNGFPVRRVIALRGNYHESNFGDDALLIAANALLAGPGRDLMVDGAAACRDHRLDGLLRLDENSHQPDLLVYGGGTQFFAFDHVLEDSGASIASGWYPRLRKMLNPMHALRVRLRLRRARMTPTIAIGLGIGPFAAHAHSAEADAARLVRRMSLVWVRDQASEEFCRRHDVTACVTGADLCFTDAFRAAVGFDACPLITGTNQPKRVGIVLRDWPGLDADFFLRMIQVARNLRKGGIDARFLSFAPTDKVYLAALSEAGEDVIAWDADYGSIEKFWAQIASHDLILTSRFHGAIFALLSGRPFVAINIEPKLAGLLEVAPGIPSPLVHANAEAVGIEQQVRRILDQTPTLQNSIARDVARQRSLANQAAGVLMDFLERELMQ